MADFFTTLPALRNPFLGAPPLDAVDIMATL
jgi:hypothetical protein